MLMIMMQVSTDSRFPNGLARIFFILQRFMQKESFVPLSIHINLQLCAIHVLVNNTYMYASNLGSSVPCIGSECTNISESTFLN